MIRYIIFVLIISNSIQAMDIPNTNATKTVIYGTMKGLVFGLCRCKNKQERQSLKKRLNNATITKHTLFVNVNVSSEESDDWWAKGHPRISKGQNMHFRGFPDMLPLSLLAKCKEKEQIVFDFYGEDENFRPMQPVTIHLEAAQFLYDGSSIPFERFIEKCIKKEAKQHYQIPRY